VLVSDGISDVLSEETILDSVAQAATSRQAARSLVDEARAAAAALDGHCDDATAVVVCWEEGG